MGSPVFASARFSPDSSNTRTVAGMFWPATEAVSSRVPRPVGAATFGWRSGSLTGSVFRTLRQGQRLIFDTVEEDGNQFITLVRLGQEGY